MNTDGSVMKLLVESHDDVAFATDAGGRLTYISPQVAKYGPAADAMTGLSPAELADQDDRPRVREVIRRAVTLGEEGRLSFRMRDPKGSERWMAGKCRPVREGDRIVGAAGFIRDDTPAVRVEQELRDANILLSNALTELKRTQQHVIQNERLGAIGQMVDGVAHNFNNSLTPIIGFTECLLKYPDHMADREDVVSILNDIRNAAVGAAETIRRLKSFCRSADGGDHADVDLAGVVKTVMMLTRPRWKDEAESRGVFLRVEERVKPVGAISGNESHLAEAIANVVLNAVDAMPSGGTLVVSTFQDKEWAVVSVQDTGTGMPEDVRQRCFEPFFTTKGSRGSGMGLAVTHGIVRQHGGRVEVESKPGRGSTFILRFPAKPGTTGIMVKEPEPEYAAAGNKYMVLVVDDEAWSRKVIEKVLAEYGHTTVSANCGAEGIEAFRNDRFDIVITDRAMPDMSGDCVAAEIKNINPRMPVLMVSGFGSLMKESGEFPPGVDAILGKPVGVRELGGAVRDLVERFRAANAP